MVNLNKELSDLLARQQALADLPTIDFLRASFGLPTKSKRTTALGATPMERVRALLPLVRTGSYKVTVRADGAHILTVNGTDDSGKRRQRTVKLDDADTADQAVEYIEWLLAEGGD